MLSFTPDFSLRQSSSCNDFIILYRKDGNKELTVVLLVDFQLEEFPLEALSFVRKMNTKSLSRDFSLQMLHHRLKGMTPEQEGK